MVTILFDGEKTYVFWIGLIILGYAISQFVYGMWQAIYYFAAAATQSSFFGLALMPSIVNGIIFLIIGVYMMNSGTNKQVAQSNTV